MRLVLVNSPIQEYGNSYRPEYRTTAPLGLGYLGTIARRNGIEAFVVDAEAEKLSVDETAERVSNLQPDFAGINMASTNWRLSLKILDRIDAPHKLVGGPHATLKGDELHGDYLVVKGEAEDVLMDVLRNPRNGVVNAGVVNDLDRLPFVDRTLFGNDPYIVDGKYEATMSTARGCVFDCVFCSVPVINGRKMRARSIGNVITEIEALREEGVNSIHFIDDLFNYSKKRVEEFCDEVIDRDLKISWRDLSRVELLDNSLLEKMRESGCYKLAFGLESGTPRILRYIGKNDDLDKVRRVVGKCNELGIETKGFFTIGYPTETEEDIRRTLDFSRSVGVTDAYFMVVRAFPGTRLYDEMRKSGFSEAELDDYQQFQDEDGYVKYHVMNFRSLNGTSNERLDNLVKEGYREFNGVENENIPGLQTQ